MEVQTLSAAEEALEQVTANVNEAHAARRYMVAVWFIDANGHVQCRRVTHDFPRGDLPIAAMKLAAAVDFEYNRLAAPTTPPFGPLPRAYNPDEAVPDYTPPAMAATLDEASVPEVLPEAE